MENSESPGLWSLNDKIDLRTAHAFSSYSFLMGEFTQHFMKEKPHRPFLPRGPVSSRVASGWPDWVCSPIRRHPRAKFVWSHPVELNL